ncbi:hypothetical protein AVEN_116664-1 [Araneus ventricosus]|uniref:RNase H type-1 domain-containing protein n=1 Tax=Araneus ventricosus TaxID=182803 RepID=A0A4Y2JQC3_ARAVE|nr:hypothetical protein AVEN_116664-1 [Araneus ventricosus]
MIPNMQIQEYDFSSTCIPLKKHHYALHDEEQLYRKQLKKNHLRIEILTYLGKLHTGNPIARYIQDSLYNTHNIRLGWIRAHVGHLGNEKADELAKEAITSTEASVLTVPLPRSSSNQDLKQRALAKWQRSWDYGINGRSTYEIIKEGRTSKS